MLGMLNSRPVPNDPLATAAAARNKAKAVAGTTTATRRAPAPAYATPPMYKPPLAPIAVPGMISPMDQQNPITPPPAPTAVTNKLEQWRQARAQRMAGGVGVVPTPTPVAITPAAPLTPVTVPAPAPVTPMVDLTKLREELVTLVQTQAPKLDLDLKLLPFNQRLQDLDLRLNNTKLMLEEMHLSLNAIQLQSSQDRRLLLNGITADDFKGLHEDLSAALHEYFVEFEDTLQKLLQEFNDRIYCVYAVTLTETPQLQGPSFLDAANTTTIPAGTRVKVCYPQQQTAEGIFIRCLAVDPQTGQITLNWIPVAGGVGGSNGATHQYLGQFSV